MLVNGDEPGSPTSNGGSELTALLEQELDAISLPGSPRTNAVIEELDKDLKKTVREKSAEPSNTRLFKRPRSGLLGNGAEQETCPPHPGFMHGICIRCGAVSAEEASEGVALRYIHTGLRLSSAEAERVRQKSSQRVLNDRKLLLVLDLDHTLLNSTRFDEVTEDDKQRLTELLEKQRPADFTGMDPQGEAGASVEADQSAYPEQAGEQAGEEEQMLYCLTQMDLWTKLRPFVREFLREAHKISEMHIYTHGNAEYAQEMAKLLDPTKQYFAERIISQGDSTLKHVKDLDVVLGADRAVVILDDTSGVWPLHQPNLLQVERYIFFQACARRFGLGRASLLQEGRDEAAEQGMLASALQVLQKVHARMFGADTNGSSSAAGTCGSAEEEGDVREHLRAVQREVLAGVRITFSRIIPQGDPAPQLHHLWRLAEQFGASVTLALDEGVTHVVAAGPLTEKVRWAQRRCRHIVSPAWLQASACLWRRLDEGGYPIDGPSNQQYQQRLSEEADTRAALAAAGGGSGGRAAD